MDIYVCGGDYAEKLCELCESLVVSKNIKQKDLLDYDFSNAYKPHYRKAWRIKQSDKYPVSFAMTIKKKGMKIESFDLLDENFMQPHPCGKEEYEQIKKIVTKMIDKNILEVYTNDK